MSTDAKPILTSSNTVQQQAAIAFPAGQSGREEIGASCQEVPVRALGRHGAGESFEEETTTMLLFPRGAVIRLAAQVGCAQELMLVNKRTNRYAHCRVTNLRTLSDGSYVEVEFTHQIPDFWGIQFPGDAARAARAVTEFAAQIPVEQVNPERVQAPEAAPTKALAAAAAVGAANCSAIAPAPVQESTVAIVTSRPDPLCETEERPSSPQFVTHRPMEVVPVCEPVADPAEISSMGRGEAMAAAPLMKWEALSVPEQRGNRTWVRAGLGTALCAVLLAFHFFSPAEAAMSIDPPSADAMSSEGSRAAEGTSRTVVHPANSDSESPSSVVVVSAPEPEMATAEPPGRRVVLVSGLTMPAQTASAGTHEAPEVSSTAGEEPGTAASSKGAGLFNMVGAAPVPPPEPAPENVVKAVQTLTPARLLSSVQPIYPPAAKLAQVQGDVVVETNIDASGKVVGMKVLSGSPLLRAAATTALAQWKFQPALLGERQTASTSVVTLHFRLR